MWNAIDSSLPSGSTGYYTNGDIGAKAFGYYYNDDFGLSMKVPGFTISGYEGSEAERYAAMNGFRFVKIIPATGDVDGDNEVTLMDVTEVQHYLSCMHTYAGEEKLIFADIDKNGLIEIIDATYIRRWLAGIAIPYTIG